MSSSVSRSLGVPPLLVQVLVRACWDEDIAHEAVLATADRVIVALTRIASVAHVNAPAVAAAQRHLRPTSSVSVAFNTLLASPPPRAVLDPSTIVGTVPDHWPLHVTDCPIEATAGAHDDGAAPLFAQLLR